jgi:hypothetical protein
VVSAVIFFLMVASVSMASGGHKKKWELNPFISHFFCIFAATNPQGDLSIQS